MGMGKGRAVGVAVPLQKTSGKEPGFMGENHAHVTACALVGAVGRAGGVWGPAGGPHRCFVRAD